MSPPPCSSSSPRLIGAVVYFWQKADTFWEHVVGILTALVWPAFLVYEAFQSLLG